MSRLRQSLLTAILLSAMAVSAAVASAPPAPPLDLNSARLARLEELAGVGPKLAQAIVAYRLRHGFRRREDLLRIKGIGLRLYARMKAHVRVVRPAK